MSNEALVLPLFNDATLAEVKEYMHLDKESSDYLFDDESVSTPIEAVLVLMKANQYKAITLRNNHDSSRGTTRPR